MGPILFRPSEMKRSFVRCSPIICTDARYRRRNAARSALPSRSTAIAFRMMAVTLSISLTAHLPGTSGNTSRYPPAGKSCCSLESSTGEGKAAWWRRRVSQEWPAPGLLLVLPHAHARQLRYLREENLVTKSPAACGPRRGPPQCRRAPGPPGSAAGAGSRRVYRTMDIDRFAQACVTPMFPGDRGDGSWRPAHPRK